MTEPLVTAIVIDGAAASDSTKRAPRVLLPMIETTHHDHVDVAYESAMISNDGQLERVNELCVWKKLPLSLPLCVSLSLCLSLCLSASLPLCLCVSPE